LLFSFSYDKGRAVEEVPVFLENSKETPKVEATIRGEIGIAV